MTGRMFERRRPGRRVHAFYGRRSVRGSVADEVFDEIRKEMADDGFELERGCRNRFTREVGLHWNPWSVSVTIELMFNMSGIPDSYAIRVSSGSDEMFNGSTTDISQRAVTDATSGHYGPMYTELSAARRKACDVVRSIETIDEALA